jgi:hypothetical protein
MVEQCANVAIIYNFGWFSWYCPKHMIALSQRTVTAASIQK